MLRLPLITRYVFVPLSWPLTLFALLAGATPNIVTFTRIALYSVALIEICLPSPLHQAGIFLFILSTIADSVDGNIARVNDQASYYGKFLDGLVDNLGDFLLPLALVVHLTNQGGPVEAIFAACIASLSLAITFTVLNRNSMIDLAFHVREGRPADQMLIVPSWLARLMTGRLGRLAEKIDVHGMNVAFDLRYLGLFAISFAPNLLDEYLFFLAAIHLSLALFYAGYRIVRAYCYLNVHRRSRSARMH